MSEAKMLVILILACLAAGASGSAPYNVGRAATAADIGARDISVSPTGAGLPRGHGTAAEGRTIYAAKCAGCHGAQGQGNTWFPQLVGGRGTLATDKALPTVGAYWPYATTVWDYIHRAMPYQNPGSLRTNEIYALTAYILFMNDIVGQHQELNEKSLAEVKMPNRDGFVPDPRPDVR